METAQHMDVHFSRGAPLPHVSITLMDGEVIAVDPFSGERVTYEDGWVTVHFDERRSSRYPAFVVARVDILEIAP